MLSAQARPASRAKYKDLFLFIFLRGDAYEISAFDAERSLLIKHELLAPSVTIAKEDARMFALSYIHQEKGQPFEANSADAVALEWTDDPASRQ